MTQRRRKTLPPVSPKTPQEIKPLIAAMTEIMEVGEGVRGDPLDRKVTMRDLLDSGIGKLRSGMRANQPGSIEAGAETPAPDLSTPPVPQGFAAQGSFYGMINLSWQIPGNLYRNHAYTNIYRNEEDNFANAQIIGREAGGFYTDYVRDDAFAPDDPINLKGYYYWITFTSVGDVEGPPNSTAGSYAEPVADIGYVTEVLTERIDESLLAQSLNTRIDKIEPLETEVAEVQTTIDTEVSRLDGRVDATAQELTTVQSSLGDDIASVQTEARTLVGGEYLVRNGNFATGDLSGWPSGWNDAFVQVRDTSHGNNAVRAMPSRYAVAFPDSGHDARRFLFGEFFEVTAGEEYHFRFSAAAGGNSRNVPMLLVVRWDDVDGGAVTYTTAASMDITSTGWSTTEVGVVLAPEGAVRARAYLRRMPGGVGWSYITNIIARRADAAFAASYTAKVDVNGMVGGFGVFNDGTEVDAGFDVDRFWIGRTNSDKRKPFIIDDGVTYIDEAMIRDASIQEAKIGPLTIGKLDLSDGTPVTTAAGLIRAEAIDVDNLTVAEAATFSGDLSSDNFQSGSAGWLIRKSGYAEFNEAMFRGNIEVQSITVNGESPVAGATVLITGFSNSRSVNSLTTHSYNITRSADAYVAEMPENSKIEFDIYLDAVSSLSGSLRRSGAYIWGDGGQGDAREASYTYKYRAAYTLRARTRVWVDGNLVIDDDQYTSSAKTDGTLSVSAGSSGRSAFRTYTYPAYKFSSRIEVQVDIVNQVTLSLASASYGSGGSFSAPSTSPSSAVVQSRVAKDRITSGQVSRIG